MFSDFGSASVFLWKLSFSKRKVQDCTYCILTAFVEYTVKVSGLTSVAEPVSNGFFLV